MAPIYYALVTLKSKLETDREKGATAVEYGLIIALIAAALITVIGLLSDQVEAAFQAVVDAIEGAIGG